MPHYLFQGAYTSESWKTQVQRQENVRDRIRPLVDGLNGQISALYYSFGDYDVVAILEMPSEEAAAAFALAVAAGGSLKTFRTTPLLTVEQGLGAMRKASEAGGAYRAPVS